MNLQEVNTLRAMTFDELETAAKERGIEVEPQATPDSLRLAIIYSVVEEEERWVRPGDRLPRDGR